MERGDSRRINPSLVSQLQNLQKHGSETEGSPFTAGFRNGIEEAIGLARAEELRIRGVVEDSDGICLDNQEDREQFILALYGAQDIETNRP